MLRRNSVLETVGLPGAFWGVRLPCGRPNGDELLSMMAAPDGSRVHVLINVIFLH